MWCEKNANKKYAPSYPILKSHLFLFWLLVNNSSPFFTGTSYRVQPDRSWFAWHWRYHETFERSGSNFELLHRWNYCVFVLDTPSLTREIVQNFRQVPIFKAQCGIIYRRIFPRSHGKEFLVKPVIDSCPALLVVLWIKLFVKRMNNMKLFNCRNQLMFNVKSGSWETSFFNAFSRNFHASYQISRPSLWIIFKFERNPDNKLCGFQEWVSWLTRWWRS
jgi:hypothetical protein